MPNKHRIIKIIVTNWDKYQGESRKSSKAKKFTWWARSNSFFRDEKMRMLGAIGRDLFASIMDRCSERNVNAISIKPEHLMRDTSVGCGGHRSITRSSLEEHLKLMERLEIIKVEVETELNLTGVNLNLTFSSLTGDRELFHGEKEIAVATQKKASKSKSKKPSPSAPIWESYRSAFISRYGTEPVRAAKQNGIISRIVAQVGIDEATELVRFYVGVNNAWYIQRAHPLELLLSDLQKILVEFRTGISLNRNQALSMETTSSNEAAMKAAMDAIDRSVDAF